MKEEYMIPSELHFSGREHEERTREFSNALFELERIVFGRQSPMVREDGLESGIAESVHDILRIFCDIRGTDSGRELAAAFRNEMSAIGESDRCDEWEEVNAVVEDILRIGPE